MWHAHIHQLNKLCMPQSAYEFKIAQTNISDDLAFGSKGQNAPYQSLCVHFGIQKHHKWFSKMEWFGLYNQDQYQLISTNKSRSHTHTHTIHRKIKNQSNPCYLFRNTAAFECRYGITPALHVHCQYEISNWLGQLDGILTRAFRSNSLRTSTVNSAKG